MTYLFLFCMCWCFALMCVCVRLLDPLGLEVQTVVGAAASFERAASALNGRAISPAPCLVLILSFFKTNISQHFSRTRPGWHIPAALLPLGFGLFPPLYFTASGERWAFNTSAESIYHWLLIHVTWNFCLVFLNEVWWGPGAAQKQ